MIQIKDWGDLNTNQLYMISQAIGNVELTKVDQDLHRQMYDFVKQVRKEIDRRENKYWDDK